MELSPSFWNPVDFLLDGEYFEDDGEESETLLLEEIKEYVLDLKQKIDLMSNKLDRRPNGN